MYQFVPRRCSCIYDLIDLSHIFNSIKALVKKRNDKRRLFLILALIAMALYTFQRDEKHMVYLYTMLKFKWDVPIFSRFRTFQSSFFVLGLLIGVPLMERCLGLRDNIIIMIGAGAHLITRIIFSVAKESYLFYIGLRDNIIIMIGAGAHLITRIIFSVAKESYLLYMGAVIASLGPVVAPVLRSLTSKLVPASDRGKIFALLSVADSTVPLLSGVIYTQVYNNTVDTFPQSIFLVTAVSQLIVFIISLIMDILTKRQNIVQAYENEENEMLNS